MDCDAVPDAAAAAGIRAFPTLHVHFRGAKRGTVVGADLRGLRTLIDAERAAVEEVLTAEALAASMMDEEGAPDTSAAVTLSGSSSSSSSSSAGQAQSTAAASSVPLASSTPNASTSSSSATTSLPAAADGPSPEAVARAFRGHLAALSEGLSRSDYTAATRTIDKYFANILSHPGAGAYTRIKRSNDMFAKTLGRHGARIEPLFSDAGFESVNDPVAGPVLVHPSSPSSAHGAAAAMDRLRACHRVLTEVIAREGSSAAPPLSAEEEDAAELAAALILSQDA